MASLNGCAAMVGELSFDYAYVPAGERCSVPTLPEQPLKIVQRLLASVNADEFDVNQDGLATFLPNIHENLGLAYGLKNDEG
ncbi:DDE endonuclease (plasmid) [Ralstonia solanacearum]|nr:DDE endonuclease [Ralstonia solanacearum]